MQKMSDGSNGNRYVIVTPMNATVNSQKTRGRIFHSPLLCLLRQMYAFRVYESDGWVERLPLLVLNCFVVWKYEMTGCKMARPCCAAKTFNKVNVNPFEHFKTFVHEEVFEEMPSVPSSCVQFVTRPRI